MPGTVSEVSAMLVASTTRRLAPGWKTLCWSLAASRPNKGNISIDAPPANRWASGKPLGQHVRGLADLALAGEEDQHVAARPLAHQLLERLDDGVLLRPLLFGVVLVDRPVPDLDRIGA